MFKNLLLIAFALCALSSEAIAARTITVYASGRANEFCNANSGFSCHMTVKRHAEDDGLRSAIYTCELQHRGRPQRYTASYSTSCNPFSLSPNHPGTWVTCNANTSVRCDLPN